MSTQWCRHIHTHTDFRCSFPAIMCSLFSLQLHPTPLHVSAHHITIIAHSERIQECRKNVFSDGAHFRVCYNCWMNRDFYSTFEIISFTVVSQQWTMFPRRDTVLTQDPTAAACVCVCLFQSRFPFQILWSH